MQSIKAPLVGDPVYGPRGGVMPGVRMSEELAEAVKGFKRQALHAARLGLVHPATGMAMQWRSELPEDMKGLLARLREDARLAVLASAEEENDEWWQGSVSPGTSFSSDDMGEGWDEEEDEE